MPKASRRSARHSTAQTVPIAPRFNVDHQSGAYFLLSPDGHRDYLNDEPTYDPVLDLPSILTLLTTGTPKVIVCALPNIILIEPSAFRDLTRPFEIFGYVASRTVATMLAQGWLHGDGVFELTDEGIDAAATLPSRELVSH